MITTQKDAQGIVTFTIDMTDKSMNVINREFVEEMERELPPLLEDKDVKGIVINSGKSDFIAGADLELITSMKDESECLALTRKLNSLFRSIETSQKPVVAAIKGQALGGGYELCLSCAHRILLDSPKSQVGLPEVKLGLMPGGGGTQRLPRLIGFQPALPLLLEGKSLNAEKALQQGLVDALAKTEEDLVTKAKDWIRVQEDPAIRPWDQKKFKLPGGEVQSPKGYQTFPSATAMLREKTWDNYPAPHKILRSVYEGLQLPIDQALEVESQFFTQAVFSPEAKNMIRTLFYGIQECNKGAARPETPKTQVKKVGILGAGMMGAGIAYASAKAGIDVILKDVSKENAQRGKAYSEKVLDKAISRGKMTEEKKREILERIIPTDDPTDVKGCDLVIEAVIEDRKIKDKVTKESEEVLSDKAVFASNTSTLPITSLAESSKRPQNFIGLHFFSPVEKMPLVEIILGEKSSDEALGLCIDYAQQIKKTPIVVNDGRGFYTSRVFTTYIAEGIACLTEGISPSLIENAGKAAGMPVGPLSVADEVSIDLIYHILKQTAEDLGEEAVNQSTYSTANLFVNKLKRLGRKSGGGFYEYPEKGNKYLWPDLAEHFPLKDEQPSLEHIKERILTIQSLESVRCLEENILTSVRDGDVGSILGWGFPAYTGGTLSYVETVGIKEFKKRCEEFEQLYGTRFQPAKRLEEMQKNNATFY